MYPVVSHDMVAGTMELVCFISTAMLAVFSYLLTLRF
jgi:hypothetical protein